MRFLTKTLEFTTALVFWILIAYWLVFVGYSLTISLNRGPHNLIAWYSHIAGLQFHWNWMKFLAGQITILVVTVLFYLLMRRQRRPTS